VDVNTLSINATELGITINMYAHELPPKSEPALAISPDVLRSASLLASAILAIPHDGPNAASLQHKKKLLARLYSFITDANGKYSAPHHS
jgi:hypothetical protein